MKPSSARYRTCALGVATLTSIAAFAAPEASTDEGRAIYALHCARCHGDTAVGGAGGPPLRPAVRAMSETAFAAKVLQRTHWTLPATGAGAEGAARDAFAQGVLRLRHDDRAMPAWQSEPEVASAVRSLYVYLAARPK
jgi:mono/diheme cytochrome c family protein